VRSPFLLTVLLIIALVCGCDAEHGLKTAEKAAQESDWPRAIRILEQYLLKEKDADKRWQAWTLLTQGSLIMNGEVWSMSHLDAMLQEFGDNPSRRFEILRRQAVCHERMRQWDKAAATWEHILTMSGLLDRERAEICRKAGLNRLRSGQWEEANRVLAQRPKLSSFPDLEAECRFLQAQACTLNNDLDQALACLDNFDMTGIEDDLYGQILFLHADILEQQEKKEEALRLFRSALSLYPNPQAVQKRLDFLEKK